jgi:twinkle protein
MIEADTIDLQSYMEATEPALKVRKASAFQDELERAFIRRGPGDYLPHMRSTKLGADLEFRPGEVTVWAGFNKHKKSMFTGQVALDLCAFDQRVLVVSLEMQVAATLSRMARQALAMEWPSRRHLADFTAWTDDRLWMFDHVGRLTPKLCLAVLRYFARELGGQHVFVDNLMKVCQSEESLDEQKQLMSDFCDVARETGLHVHVIAHCRKPTGGDDSKPPSRYDLRGSSTISDLPHNIVIVWANRAKEAALRKDPNAIEANQPDARISVEGQRNGRFEGSVGLWFDDATLRFSNDRMSRIEPYDIPMGGASENQSAHMRAHLEPQ